MASSTVLLRKIQIIRTDCSYEIPQVFAAHPDICCTHHLPLGITFNACIYAFNCLVRSINVTVNKTCIAFLRSMRCIRTSCSCQQYEGW